MLGKGRQQRSTFGAVNKLSWPDGQPLNMTLDDGGDLTNLVHTN